MNISSKQESARFFQNSTVNDIRRDYFNTLMAAVETGLFDSIAHVDLYLRYGLLHFGPAVLTIHRGVIEPIFAEMARRGMGLEINTSSCRRGLKDFHPTRELLSLAADAGIEVFTVGSDAHALHELGDQIDAALALLTEFKLTNHIFTQRQAFPYPQSPLEANPVS
jgi:histidinol-phosphatase (PHP family)